MNALGIEAPGLVGKQFAEVTGANGKIVSVARAIQAAMVKNDGTTAPARGGEVIAAPIGKFWFCGFGSHVEVVPFLDS